MPGSKKPAPFNKRGNDGKMGSLLEKNWGKREGNQENFLNNIKKFIVHLLEAVPSDIENISFSDYQEQRKRSRKEYRWKMPEVRQ